MNLDQIDVIIRTRDKTKSPFLEKVLDTWKTVNESHVFNIKIVEGLEVTHPIRTPETLGEVTHRAVQNTTTDVIYFCDDDVTPPFNAVDLTERIYGDYVKVNSKIAISDARVRRLFEISFKPLQGFPLCAINGDFIRGFNFDSRIRCHEDGLFLDYIESNRKMQSVHSNVLGVHYAVDWREKMLAQALWYTANMRLQFEQGLQPKEKPFTERVMKKMASNFKTKMQMFDRVFAQKYSNAVREGYNHHKKYLRC